MLHVRYIMLKKYIESVLHNSSTLRLYVTGFIMGAADIVPGVSGGTVAFLMGIYEELIQSIKTMSGHTLRLFMQGKVKEAWKTIPFKFILPLGLGLVSAILMLSKVFAHLLQAYPQFLWAFFFGLVLASIWVVSKRLVTWDIHDYAAAFITAILAYFIVGAVPIETPKTYLALFLSGAIAICAMILPGISGSFLLVIMGKYEQVLSAVNNREIVPIVVFMLGAVVGLSLFSRVLSWLFHRHHDIVVATLIGFMIGSLRKVWPWKEVIATRVNSHGEIVPLIEKNILPGQLDGSIFFAIVLILVGLALVLLLDKLQITKEQFDDIDDKKFKQEHKEALQSQKEGVI
jgi:putative membrane protein